MARKSIFKRINISMPFCIAVSPFNVCLGLEMNSECIILDKLKVEIKKASQIYYKILKLKAEN